LFAQIPGEGASPRVRALWKGVCALHESALVERPLTPTLSPQAARGSRKARTDPYVSANAGRRHGAPFLLAAPPVVGNRTIDRGLSITPSLVEEITPVLTFRLGNNGIAGVFCALAPRLNDRLD